MAVNDTNLERDPALARLMQAASGEQPPAALDAAILAAARREVGARPAVVGGCGQAAIPPLRAKRNWYVPVSIAAMMVLSISLVLTMHHEKGDELSQPPVATRAPPKAPASAPAPAAEPAVAPAEKADAMLRDAAPAQPKLAEEKRAQPAKTADAISQPEAPPKAYGELAKKQRVEKTEAAADNAGALGSSTRRDQAVGSATREHGPARDSAATTAKAASGAVTGGLSGAPAPQDRAPVEARREAEASGRQAQERQRPSLGVRGFDSAPLDGASGVPAGAPAGAAASQSASPLPREAKLAPAKPTPEPFPAQAPLSRDEALARNEADRSTGGSSATRGATSEAPAVAAAPQAKPAPPPAPKPAARPALKPAPVWRGLEDQPPEKWLERLAEFRRDNRSIDADELLAEFRRRFPDHPASAR